MTNSKLGWKLRAMVVGLVLGTSSVGVAEVRYALTDLGTLGGPQSQGMALSSNGQVAGIVHVPNAFHGFRWSNGVMTDIPPLPQLPYCQGLGINSSGQVVGDCYLSGGGHGFLYSGGVTTDIGAVGPQAINDLGQITGQGRIGGGTSNVFLYSGGQFIDLGKPGVGSAINNAGQIAGAMNFGTTIHAFLYSGGQFTDLGGLLPPGLSSAEGIGPGGEAVGRYEPIGGGQFAFLYAGGQMRTLGNGNAFGVNSRGEVVGQEYLQSISQFRARLFTGGQWADLNQFLIPGSGWTLIDAEGINDLGQIAGSGVAPDGHLHAYLLTPVPEPASVGWFLLGAWALMVRGSRHASRTKRR